MHRIPVLTLAVVLAACAGNSRPVAPAAGAAPVEESRPEQIASTPSAAARGPAASDSSAIPPAPALEAQLDLEVAAEMRAAADSAADAEALESLAAAHPAGGDDADGGSNAVATAVTWDIDVSTFNDHDRVQYYLDLFTRSSARERFTIWLRRLPRYETMIRDRLQKEDLPGDLVYLALIESGFSNRAVSHASAVGMWQFMRPTGRGSGLRIDGWVDERRDPVKATDAAARHLRDLRRRFGSVYLAAAAYNAGGGKVGRGLNALPEDEEADSLLSDATFFRLYDTKLIRRETKDYVPKLIAAALIAKEPGKYGFTVTDPDPPFEADSIIVTDMTGLDVIARLAGTTVATVRDLNPQYLRLATPPGSRSVVRLPVGSGERTAAAYAELPPSKRVTFREHYVTKGQTASGIARRYGVALRELYEANPKIRNKRLRAGQRLVIPTGGALSTVVARQVADPDVKAVEFHKVRRGETISGIASRYQVSQAQVRSWNSLGKSSRIRIGQRLRVGPSATQRARSAASSPDAARPARVRTHKVARGDTLTGISKRYGVSIAAIRDANGMSGSSSLKAGASLRIPR